MRAALFPGLGSRKYSPRNVLVAAPAAAIFAGIISSSRAGRVMVRQRRKARQIAANITKLPEFLRK